MPVRRRWFPSVVVQGFMKVRQALSAAFLCSLLGVASSAAQEPPADFLKDMPEPAVVLAEFPGPENLDLSARRVAALEILSDVVQGYSLQAPGGRWLVPEERALNTRYHQAAYGIRNPIYDAFGEEKVPYEESKKGKWNKRVDDYRHNEQFASRVLQHVPPQVRDSYLTSMRRNLAYADSLERVSQTSGVRAQVGGTSRPTSVVREQVGWTTRAENYLILGGAIVIVVILGCGFLLSLRV